MSKIRVGVVGCGAIGREHARRIANLIPETELVGVADFFQEAAEKTAAQFGVKAYASAEELIHSDDIDAFFITSSDPSHAGYVLEGLKAKKFIFCEKPLAQTSSDAEAIIKAELELGKKYVQVGFMRRYDRGYSEMKRIIESGEIGDPLMIHSAHRNVSQAPGFLSNSAITQVAIHELDISRWLLDDEYEEAQVLEVRQSKSTKGDWKNPLIVTMKTKSGQRIDVEVQCSEAFAYDIQCQVVCEDGLVNLPDPMQVTVRKDAKIKKGLMTDWAQRFIEAYDIELAAWAKSIAENGEPNGPNSWDGYVACCTADALIKSRETGVPEKVLTIDKPELYK
ncbi:MAG: Gfo/Idh/MocA family oxidoreductase [Clostridiales Family XIII bacterium]|jgi:myo-inositol 2-dehydrogenase/D-chiro-inositol 1-dehydrogenase|nr:Gfo/Idh/MocA family oxidoreductase [Clostridiales Family XIII bacterium]